MIEYVDINRPELLVGIWNDEQPGQNLACVQLSST